MCIFVTTLTMSDRIKVSLKRCNHVHNLEIAYMVTC